MKLLQNILALIIIVCTSSEMENLIALADE